MELAATGVELGEDGKSPLIQHAYEELSHLDVSHVFTDGLIDMVRIFRKISRETEIEAGFVVETLHNLLSFKHLTPLTNDPNEWVLASENSEGLPGLWQSKRNPEAFSTDYGKHYYLLSERRGRGHRRNALYISEEK